MKCSFAPMEGITGYLFRNAHHQFYGHIDHYYTPFITPTQTRKLTSRELNDILPEHNAGIPVIPQILGNHAENFRWAAERIRELGYREINLNLGCPSATVVSKHRGAGLLGRTEELEGFLDSICDSMQRLGMELSVKTRIGMADPSEFEDLIQLYNRFPLKELIVHPRVRTDFYKNHPNLDAFALAVQESRHPLCYNGDLFSIKDVQTFHQRFPQVEHVMVGRGLLANPSLAGEICGVSGAGLDKKTLRAYHDAIFEAYSQIASGDRNVLFKMKELWCYLGDAFADSEKQIKKIRKSQHRSDYETAVSRLFAEYPLADPPAFRGWKP
ncbi:MAG: tRNA-dihydrouridine synthase family protein [Lachnospiraceae bacterium]|nr:tRNA-dihydrouridine synthase family protein [Lachnospiraceae bacterium]